MRPPEELLYDSEASLRLVDHAIEELNDAGADLDSDARGFLNHVMNQPGGFAELSRTLLRAYAETVGIVQRLRETTGMVDPRGVDKMHQMTDRLREITGAMEKATTGILDSVNRAVAVLDKAEGAHTDEERRQLRASLREELSAVANHLQFQDITAQQLGHITSQLSDMRHRITQIVTIFTQPTVNFSKEDHGAFDPNASTAAAHERQAVADEIFAVRTDRKTA